MNSSPSDSGAPAGTPLRGYRILVVDDEDDTRVFIATVLADAGAEVTEAADGEEALAMARRDKPDLITLDLSMPGKDGVETFYDLRNTPETEELAVCIVTGHSEFRKVIYDRPVLPPEGFMSKPIREGDLVANVRRILSLRKRRAWRRVRLDTPDDVS